MSKGFNKAFKALFQRIRTAMKVDRDDCNKITRQHIMDTLEAKVHAVRNGLWYLAKTPALEGYEQELAGLCIAEFLEDLKEQLAEGQTQTPAPVISQTANLAATAIAAITKAARGNGPKEKKDE
jgi:hypothetical protein